ncbi:hypothetical protein EIP91_012300, partial [Steccherinum ochraceum]
MRFINMLPVTDETCHRVQHLELQSHKNHNVTDDDLADILPDCPNLETVILSGVPDLSDRSLVLLASNATALKHVDLSGCKHITSVGITALDSHASSLEVLRLNHVPLLTDPAISAIALSLSHLVELELSDSILLTAISIRDIWSYAKRIKRLRLARCAQLTDKAFPYAFPPSPVQPRKRLFGVDLPSRKSVPEQYSMDAMTASAERPLTWLEALPPLILPPTYMLEELRLLDLTNCYKLTDDAIIGITTHAPRIQTFLLSGCFELTDRALESLGKLGHHLDVLTLAHVDQITDRGVSVLCSACPRLRSVDVSYCSRLTDLSILEFGSLLELNRLIANNIPAITDNSVLFLADHALTIADLQLSYCPQISLEAFHTLILRLTRLEQLSMSGIPSFTRKGLKQFSESPPLGYNENFQGLYRVFRGNNVDEL